jgi:predicted nucleic acid-binding protein
MIHSVRFTALLDTNVIYPIVVRDLFFWLAHYELYTPKWSKNIFDEWEKVMLEKGIERTEVLKRIQKANDAFPDALVKDYEKLIKSLELPDKKDRHVLAAAIKVNADLIVTNNLKDFPQEYLDNFEIKVKNADEFLTDIIDLDQEVALKAFKEMVLNRKNPVMDEYAVLDSLRKNGLNKTADYLHTLL